MKPWVHPRPRGTTNEKTEKIRKDHSADTSGTGSGPADMVISLQGSQAQKQYLTDGSAFQYVAAHPQCPKMIILQILVS